MPLPPADRFRALTPRERRFLGVGAAALLAFILYLLAPDAEAPAVELGEAPVTEGLLSEPAELPPPERGTRFAPPPPAAAGAGAASGLVLHGVLGGGPGGGAAIIGFPDGGQRAVRVGRQFLPGLTLKEVGQRHALVAGPGGDTRLALERPPPAPRPDQVR
ncbi:MAG TPA: hypothetical protein VGW34_11725 [Allosphingosinicella sp.]|nr:hypothetical protein [Allosphingosinicella sp.]